MFAITSTETFSEANAEVFADFADANDAAFDWSVELSGRPVLIWKLTRNQPIKWMKVTAWFFTQTHSLFSQMFITNDFAKKDLACQIAMANYKKQLERENHYRQQVRDGLIPAPNWNDTQTWNISDRD